jgi:hypothetical protein
MGKDSRSKRGGGVLLPIGYFNPTQRQHYFPAGSPQLKPGPSAYGPTVAVDMGTRNGNMVGPNYGATKSTNLKTGGGNSNPYNTIVNPFTGRKCSLFSKKGSKVLSYYLEQLEQ